VRLGLYAKCGFAHSKEADIPLHNWDDALRSAESEPAEYFWKGFFRAATEHADSYWKQCNACADACAALPGLQPP
jgi:hypothetical protein